MQTLQQAGPRLPSVARTAIERWSRGLENAGLGDPETPAAPVFVTLRNPDGSLRGCIGTLEAARSDVCSETARSAVLAASRDPRFPPLEPSELSSLSIEVSVLLPGESIDSAEDLDPSRYGVVVRDDQGRRGVLLPEVTGVETPQMQVSIARDKAGIPPQQPVQLERFEVLKFR